jgi:hypothetical protein
MFAHDQKHANGGGTGPFVQRFYAGPSVGDAARTTDDSDRTVKRDWRLARAWLYEELSREGVEVSGLGIDAVDE